MCFGPEKDAQLLFEIPVSPPPRCKPKFTSLLGDRARKKRQFCMRCVHGGFRVEEETAENGCCERCSSRGQTAQSMRADPVNGNRRCCRWISTLFDQLPVHEALFTDTSFIEDVVYSRRAGSVGPNGDWLNKSGTGRCFSWRHWVCMKPPSSHGVADTGTSVGLAIQEEYRTLWL